MPIDDFEKTLSNVVLGWPYLVEAMVRAFARLKNLTIEVGGKGGERIVFAYEPEARFR